LRGIGRLFLQLHQLIEGVRNGSGAVADTKSQKLFEDTWRRLWREVLHQAAISF
jgi:hypothetical protein